VAVSQAAACLAGEDSRLSGVLQTCSDDNVSAGVPVDTWPRCGSRILRSYSTCNIATLTSDRHGKLEIF